MKRLNMRQKEKQSEGIIKALKNVCKSIIAITPGVFPIFLFGQDITFDLFQLGGPGHQIGQEIMVTNSKEGIISASFNEVFPIATDSFLTTKGKTDACILSFDFDQKQVNWIVQFGSEENDELTILTTDADNNIITGGVFWVEMVFGNSIITTLGSQPRGLFVAKMDSNGTPIWIRTILGEGLSEIEGISTGQNGEIYISGFFEKTANFLGTTIEAKAAIDSYLARINSGGNLEWIRQITGTGKIRINEQTISTQGWITAAGNFDNQVIVMEDTLKANSNDLDLFLVQFDDSGNYQWLVKAGGVFEEQARSLITKEDQSMLLTGAFVGVLEAEGQFRLESQGGSPDIFVLNYNLNGEVMMARSFPGELTQTPVEIIEAGSKLFLNGTYSGDWIIDDLFFEGVANRNFGFFIELDENFQVNTGYQFQSEAGNVFFSDLTINQDGQPLLLGSFEEDLNSGSIKLTTDEQFDLFLAYPAESTPLNAALAEEVHEIKVFPVPSSGIVRIETDLTIDQVSVISISGAQKSIHFSGPKNEIYFDQNGIYILRILTQENKIYHQKVIIH